MINLTKLRCLSQLSMRSRFFVGDDKDAKDGMPGLDADEYTKDLKT